MSRGGNVADGWNHNTHYHEVLLSAVPRPCRRALDVGSGLGAFARRLTEVADHVDALERDPDVFVRAQGLSDAHARLRLVRADFLAWTTSDRYDFISLVATLHHLPFAAAMTRAVELLAPGGVLAVLGLDRAPSLPEAFVRSAIAYPVSLLHRFTRPTSDVGAPIASPSMTLGEIRRQAAAIVPSAAIRRRLLWRYTLFWTKPAAGL